ncbi:DUF2326 domain-containing protein [Streptomyces caniscabiei]|uniref:DUF2326 domain-containing protein n=1 Tax=Streptomyces caniscabiei TaxID=2746961 RepID=UPI0029A7206E|nr:DUF2326 domain-containing protein [Streptomyces caniscabiei]MDX2776505.1 DUF2326 domain-containing protein [Streptomyces caniscabiei]
MYLTRLYSEPEGLFEPIEFKDGLNLIIAHRPQGVKGKSLNGVGKSTALDLIDFCLLGSYKQGAGNRLVAAKKIIEDYHIVLEFEVEGRFFTIKRSAANPNKILFGKVDEKLEEYSINALSPILCDLIFLPTNYQGKYLNTWLRVLMHFFLKIHKYKSNQFVDPIEYMVGPKAREFTYYHLFLLGIDNNLFYKNSLLRADYNKVEATRDKTRELAEETYGVDSINEKKTELQQIRRELKRLESNIEKFQLADNYQDAENEANRLTVTIKSLWLENLSDRKRHEELRNSATHDAGFTEADARRVSKLYKELSEDFGIAVRSTLSDAVKYRRQLVESRQNFIAAQVKSLEDAILRRISLIEEAETERASILSFLSTKAAISDLSEAYLAVSRKRQELADLESIILTNDKLETELLEITNEESKLNLEIKTFVSTLQAEELQKITDTFLDIYSAIYKYEDDLPTFSILEKMSSDSKVEIKVKVPSGYSKARNQGRVLIYDLTVLFTRIRKKQRGPRFLVHDGVFDGMDPAHFTDLYKFLAAASSKTRFQYIATLNESGKRGALSEAFTDENELSMDQLIEESILDLTPDKKLFGVTFND